MPGRSEPAGGVLVLPAPFLLARLVPAPATAATTPCLWSRAAGSGGSRGSVGAGSTTCCLEGVRLILKLLFCSCSCVLLHVKPTCSHVNSGVFVPQPLVLHQDSSILATRDLRLEKRTLFR